MTADDEARPRRTGSRDRHNRRDREQLVAAPGNRRRPHAIPSGGQAFERRAPFLIGADGCAAKRRQRADILDRHLVLRDGGAVLVDDVDVKNGAGLYDHGAAIDERLFTGDGEIRQARPRERRRNRERTS
jgi:hypothetical protein